MVIKLKKIIFTALFVIFLIASISTVSAENMTDDAIMSVHDESFDLSEVNTETHLASSNEANNNLLSSQSDSENLNMPEIDIKGPKVDIDVPDVDISPQNSSLIVQKHWEGNYSGSVEEIEIQLLKKIYQGFSGEGPEVDVNLPKSGPVPGPAQQKASFVDIINTDILSNLNGDLIILPDKNGVLTTYMIIKTVKLTKANNWRHIFTNLTFISAYKNSTGHWVLGDSSEYIIREINMGANSELISSSFVKYLTSPVDGLLNVYWNLTNRFIENETNNTNEEINETNTTEEIPVYDDHAKGPDSPEENPEKSSQSKNEESGKNIKKNVDVSKATGNPLFILLIVLALLIAPVLRKK